MARRGLLLGARCLLLGLWCVACSEPDAGSGKALVDGVSKQTGARAAEGAGAASPRIRMAAPESSAALARAAGSLEEAALTPTEPEVVASRTNALIKLTNELRLSGARCGSEAVHVGQRVRLVWNAALARAAQSHAEFVARTGHFSHENLSGERPNARALNLGYTGTSVAEVLAWGQDTPDQVLEEWLQSPRHCQAILSAQHDEAGAGFVRGKAGKPIWVMLIGRLRASRR